MPLVFHESPFHVTHDEETASKMAMKVDLSIMLTQLIRKKGWTQQEAAEKLGIHQSRVSELKNMKTEKFTIDAMFDMLDTLGFRYKTSINLPESGEISFTVCKTETYA